MNELEVIQALNDRTHLVASLPDKDQQIQRAAEFTRRVAWALRDRGYGNVRKTMGAQVQGLSIDVIMHGATGAAYDIIVGKGTDNPQVAFNAIDPLDPRAYYVAPVAPPDEPPAPAPVPAPQPPPQVDELAAVFAEALPLIQAIVDAAAAIARAAADIREQIAVVNRDGVKFHFRP